MAYPGFALAIMVGVAIGAAIYYLLPNEYTNSRHQEEPYGYGDDRGDRDNFWTVPDRTNTDRRKRRLSNHACSICLTEFNNNERRKSLSCGHLFHESCIYKWLHEKPTCPICRKEIL